MGDKYQQLIIKSLIEELSEEENRELSRWMDSDINNKKRFEKIKQTWNKAASLSLDFNPNTQAAWKNIKSKLNFSTEGNINDDNHTIYPKSSFGIIWKAAAIILMVIGITFITLKVTENSKEEQQSLAQTYSATSQKSFIQLADGSKVWLNKNTRLTCESNFNDQTRTVHLTGEAFFEVVKNPNKPFIILSGSAKTTVLGTAFNLRAYNGENNTELIVVHGKVSFANNNTSGLILEKGDKGIINNETGEAMKSVNMNLNFLAWKDEKLYFNKTEFEDVRKDIESYFSVEIEIQSQAIRKCYFTGTFEKPQLEDVLNVIQVTMNINHKKEKSKIVLSGNGCN